MAIKSINMTHTHRSFSLRHTLRAMSNGLWPSACLLCGFTLTPKTQATLAPTLRSRTVCAACCDALPALSHRCKQCANVLPDVSQHTSHMLCGACLTKQPLYHACYALFPYVMPLPSLIIGLKFRQQLHYTPFFVEQFLARLPFWYPNQPLPDLILPMPLHPSRLKMRGFNQAIEIASPLAKALGLPLDLTGILRHKTTARQSGLSAKAREENLTHAFIHTRSYANLHVAVLDDVVTTGQTIAACSQALQDAKAKRIDIWCCARR